MKNPNKKEKIRAWAFMFNNKKERYFAEGDGYNMQYIYLKKPKPISNPFGLPNKWKPTKLEIIIKRDEKSKQ